MEYLAIFKMIGPWIFAGGAAWGGIRAGLNGQRTALAKVSKDLDAHITVYHTDTKAVTQSLTRLETQVGLILDHKIKG